jgi:hypothetical protein
LEVAGVLGAAQGALEVVGVWGEAVLGVLEVVEVVEVAGVWGVEGVAAVEVLEVAGVWGAARAVCLPNYFPKYTAAK